MIFGRFGSGFGWRRGPSLVGQLLAMRALRAETPNGAIFIKAETERGAFHLKAETNGHD